MAFDAFISYSSKDRRAADAACAVLEAEGIRCWMAPRDILAGADWGASIIEAIDTCRVMVLIFSASANGSLQIRNEIVHAVGQGIPIVPIRIDDVMPTKTLSYYMSAVHWLDALTPPIEQHLKRLAQAVRSLLEVGGGTSHDDAAAGQRPVPAQSGVASSPARDTKREPHEPQSSRSAPILGPRSGWGRLLAVAAACVLLVGAWALGSRFQSQGSRGESVIAAPVSPAADKPAAVSPTRYYYVDGLDPNGYNWLALRFDPSPQSKWSDTHMGPGTLLTVLSQSGDYYYVRLLSGETGWASVRYVKCCRTKSD
ncbi:MAG: TIR domain-containing protein [Hyphomicrobiales bacterium]